jgi:hypothetical protein
VAVTGAITIGTAVAQAGQHRIELMGWEVESASDATHGLYVRKLRLGGAQKKQARAGLLFSMNESRASVQERLRRAIAALRAIRESIAALGSGMRVTATPPS